jgi:hypothetical protein
VIVLVAHGSQYSVVDKFIFAFSVIDLIHSQKSGNYIESFTSMGLHPDGGKPLNSEDEDILKWCSAGLYTGGADTVNHPHLYIADLLSDTLRRLYR